MFKQLWFSKYSPATLLLFLFIGLTASGTVGAQQSSGPSPEEELSFWEELAFWEAVKDSQDPAELQAYLDAYPQGRFASLARVRLRKLTEGEQAGGESPSSAAGPDRTSRNRQSAPKSTPARSTPYSRTATSQTFRDCVECPKMVVVPPGRFTMGADGRRPDERPAHQVTIDYPFAMSVYEITIAEWDACLQDGDCTYSPAGRKENNERLPISNVSWEDARDYTRWLSDKTGEEYRLPSEAEWEYATRGGMETAYWWGDDVGEHHAHCKVCGSQWNNDGPLPVGSFKPNPFGLYDVHGNVWEWTADCWNSNYNGAPQDGSVWTDGDCWKRVLRGGAWKLDGEDLRASRRNKYDRDVRYHTHGFRVVRSWHP
jgi:formylglycine-generating enzyme required for sulfatase activity